MGPKTVHVMIAYLVVFICVLHHVQGANVSLHSIDDNMIVTTKTVSTQQSLSIGESTVSKIKFSAATKILPSAPTTIATTTLQTYLTTKAIASSTTVTTPTPTPRTQISTLSTAATQQSSTVKATTKSRISVRNLIRANTSPKPTPILPKQTTTTSMTTNILTTRNPSTTQSDSTNNPKPHSYKHSKTKTWKSVAKPAPYPDPKSSIPVIIQELRKWLPREYGNFFAGSRMPNATQLRDIYQYIQGIKNIVNTPQSILQFIQELQKTHLFDVLKTTQPPPNTTQTPTTPDPFTSWWEQCTEDLEITVNALITSELWALKMFDASGKPSHSILEGSRKFFGNYKECTGTESGLFLNRSRVEGNICRWAFDLDIDINGFPLSRRIEWDLCLPKSCEGSDLTLLANQAFDTITQVSNSQVICTKDLDLYQDAGAIFAICILTIVCLLVTAGTLLDMVLAVESEDDDNYIINAYNIAPSKTASLNEGFELRESSFTAPKGSRRPRPPSRVDEIKDSLDLELQHISANGRGPSVHGGIGRPVMGLRGVSQRRMYENDEAAAATAITSNVKVNPMFMPGEDAIGGSDRGSVDEFNIGGDDDDEAEDDTHDKKDNAESLPRWQKIVVAFSVRRNMKKILGIKPLPGSINCVHGIKVLSMGWVILGHTYNSILKTFQNSSVSHELISTIRGQIVYNATFAVDTFFLISGLLTAYLLMKECSKIKRIPPKTGIMYFVHRLWRLTPPYMLWIMVVATILQYVGEGRPAWRDYDMADKCRENWWTNLLYINNVYKNKEMCLTPSWYFANVMQFHVVAPLALIPWICGFRVIGFLISGLMVALHLTSNIWLQLDLDGADLTRNRSDYIYKILVQPYARVAPYAFGLMMGWCLWKCKSKMHINKYTNGVGWLVCLFVVVTLTLVTYDKNKDLHPKSNKWTTQGIAVFETLSRPLWSLAVSWIVVACATGNGGFINSFLSWGGWLPLSRLTYCVYIVHDTVISFEEAAVESVMFFTETLMVYRFFGFLVMSYLVGLMLSLVAESPMIAVERVLIHKK